jgi:hypothetical protein
MTLAANTDLLVAGVFRTVAQQLTQTGLSGDELRERQHLDPFCKDAFERYVGARPISQTLRTADFPGLGPVDVIVNEPRVLIELRWSYLMPDKVFESVWDAVKLALLGQRHGYDALCVATGASLAAWSASESADLFGTGEINTADMWRRPLLPPRWPNWGKTIGEDLVIGGRGNQPRRAPARIVVHHLVSVPVAADYEIRVVRVAAPGPLVDWPLTEVDVHRPKPSPPPIGDDGSMHLPPRVTQRWIEAVAPALTPDALRPFLQALRVRGWNEAELRERVLPYLPPH